MSDMSRRVEWSFLGRVPYGEGVALQERVRAELRRGEGPERLLLLEHPPVYTLGRNAAATDITAPTAWLAAQGIAVHESDRGGQATYHGPGQLVGYPILDLNPDRRDIRRYVADLCTALIRTLADLGVEAVARPSPQIGVWVGEEKIASLGVHLSRWITTHGFALNVTTDLGHFHGLVPCGMPGVRLTSVERLTGVRHELGAVAAAFLPHFAEVFDRHLEPGAPPRLAAENAASPLDPLMASGPA
jgi:lipoyl(octanoyl) transferase